MSIKAKEIKLVPIKSVKFYSRNRNKHSPDQIDRIKKLLEYQGMRVPLIVDSETNEVIAGNGRLEAMQKMKWKEVPVIYQTFDSEEQRYAFSVSDNAVAGWAELDFSGINIDIGDFGPDFDLELLGMKDFTVDVADKIPQCDEDESPSVPKIAKTRKGDIWTLGSHRLKCGDSTSMTDTDSLFRESEADITFTSPPYNLGDNVSLRDNGKDTAYITKTDHKSLEDYLQFLKDFTSICILKSKYSFINIQMLSGNKLIMSEYWNHFKNNLCDMMIWDKEHAAPAMAPNVLNSVFELIFIFANEEFPNRAIRTGEPFRGTIQNIFRLNPVGKKDALAKDHGAVFPVALAEFFVANFSKESVYDPFGGSGTTLIACEKLGRKCFTMEIEPIYCDVILQRFLNYSGVDPIRDDGQVFSQMKSQ